MITGPFKNINHVQDVYHLVSTLVLQVWLCGGSIEVIPCSKVAHIERAVKPYLPDLSVMMKRNALRVAEVWMDEYKHNVNIAWNLPLEVRARPRANPYDAKQTRTSSATDAR